MDHLCYLCLVFVMLSCLFIAALWSPERKGLTSWLLFVIFNCDFATFPFGILGQVFCLFDLILYVPLTILPLNRDRSSWVESVLI